MGFVLHTNSLNLLQGVHPDLVKVVNDCATNGVLPFTFAVTEGLRTIAQQKADVAAGKSQTMRSRHLDGHAADLVVIANNQATWAWPCYYTLADQMRLAGIRCGVPLTWGGVWDKEMADYTASAEIEMGNYTARGGRFHDGPHYELPWAEYPSGGPSLTSPSTAPVA